MSLIASITVAAFRFASCLVLGLSEGVPDDVSATPGVPVIGPGEVIRVRRTANSSDVSWSALVSRWVFGMGLVSWRYLWQTTPLHRTDTEETAGCRPPAIPEGIANSDLQRIEDGVGDAYRRLFTVRIADPRLDARALMRRVITDLGRHVPREVVQVSDREEPDRPLRPGDDFAVDMPGPWNGPVRIVLAEETRLRLATRQGHLEAGQIEFHADDDGTNVVFQIETWARPSNQTVRLLYSYLRLAKEIQLNMWVRVCKAAVRSADGRMCDGIDVDTRRDPA